MLEFERDVSVSLENAETAYFASRMNVHKRQLIAKISRPKGVYVQAGEMQLMLGDIEASTGIKGAGDLLRKFVGSRVTGESAIKPCYIGDGTLVLEPTFKYIIFEEVGDWNPGLIVEDGMFLAAEDTIDMRVVHRNTASSLLLGNEGIFNTAFYGKGIVALESPVPRDEIITVDMVDDVLKLDGSMAIAWSSTLDFTVEKTTQTFVGSLASGEGLVNVYRGTGRVLIAPVRNNRGISVPSKY